jgi:hypothetical protein
MKSSSTLRPTSHKKTKSKQLTQCSNNFSEKYFQHTKEKTFTSTPKKTHLARELGSPRDSRNFKNEFSSSKKRLESPYAARNQKININMEIKNFNIYSSSNNSEQPGPKDPKKKKLHKKTISCLNNIMQKEPIKLAPKEEKKPLKHTKTRSQDNLKLNPKEWSDLISTYAKPKKDEDLVTKVAYRNRCGFCPDKKNKINQDAFIVI